MTDIRLSHLTWMQCTSARTGRVSKGMAVTCRGRTSSLEEESRRSMDGRCTRRSYRCGMCIPAITKRVELAEGTSGQAAAE